MPAYWSKVETSRPSKWHSPHPASTSEATLIVEGADKLNAQLGLECISAGRDGRSVAIFSYKNGVNAASSDDSDIEGEEDATTHYGRGTNAQGHPHFRLRDSSNPLASVSALIDICGLRRGDHKPIIGDVTIAVGMDGGTQQSSNTLAAAEAAVSSVLSTSYATARHVAQMNSGVGTFGKYPLVAAEPTGAANGSAPQRAPFSFVRNAPENTNAKISKETADEAGLFSRTDQTAVDSLNLQRRLLVTARVNAVRNLVVANPIGEVALVARLLYESHLRSLSTTCLDFVSPKSEIVATGMLAIEGPTVASANAIEILRGVQHTNVGRDYPRQAYTSALFTQFLLDAVNATVSRHGEDARSVPISPFLTTFFLGSLAGAGSQELAVPPPRTLAEKAHSILRTALFDQLISSPKSLLSRAYAGVTAEDDGLTTSDASSSSSRSSSCFAKRDTASLRPTADRTAYYYDLHYDEAIATNMVPIHPCLFLSPAVPLFPNAPLPFDIASYCVRTNADVPYVKPTKLVVDGPSRERSGLRGVPCYYGSSLSEERTNALIWGLVESRRIVGNGISYQQQRQTPINILLYSEVVSALESRVQECLKTLPLPTVAAIFGMRGREGARFAGCEVGPGQTSATMLLHYAKLMLKAAFTEWKGLSHNEWQRLTAEDIDSSGSSSSDSESDNELEEKDLFSDSDDEYTRQGGDGEVNRVRGSAGGLAGDALLSAFGGGCRFIAIHTYTYTDADGEEGKSLQGGISAVAGRHFYFSQLSHYDRLFCAILAKNMAATKAVINEATRSQPKTRGCSSNSNSNGSLVAADETLEVALADLAALDLAACGRQRDRILTAQPIYHNNGANKAKYRSGQSTGVRSETCCDVSSPLSAYVVRGLSTDHPCHPKMDLLIVALGSSSNVSGGSHFVGETTSVIVIGFPAASGQEPCAAATAMEAFVKAMAGCSRSEGSVDEEDASDSSSDDDLTIADIRQGQCPHGGAFFGKEAAKVYRKRGKAFGREDPLPDGFAAAGAGGARPKGSRSETCGFFDCCAGEVEEESFVGFTYGAEPAVEAVWNALHRKDCSVYDAASVDVNARRLPPHLLSEKHRFRKHGLVKRRRMRLLALESEDEVLWQSKQKDKLRAANAVNGTLAALHDGARPSSNVFVVDPSSHWSPLSLAGPHPNECSGKHGYASLRKSVKRHAKVLASEGSRALSGEVTNDACTAFARVGYGSIRLGREQRRLALLWDNDKYKSALRAVVGQEQKAARAELVALRTRIERIERSGELQRVVRGPNRNPPLSSFYSSTNNHAVPVIFSFNQQEPMHRLYDKLVRRERFLSLLVLARPMGSVPSAPFQPCTLSELLTQMFRYAAKCGRAAREFFGLANGRSLTGDIKSSAKLSLVVGDPSCPSAYDFSVGPMIDAAIGDGKGPLLVASRPLGAGGLLSGGAAMALCERALVGASLADGKANYRHLHGYAASSRVGISSKANTSSEANTRDDATNTHARESQDFAVASSRHYSSQTPLQLGMLKALSIETFGFDSPLLGSGVASVDRDVVQDAAAVGHLAYEGSVSGQSLDRSRLAVIAVAQAISRSIL